MLRRIKKSFLFRPGTKTQFLGCPVHNLVRKGFIGSHLFLCVTSKVAFLSKNISYLFLSKVKVLPLQATKALRTGRGIALPNLIPRH